MKELFSPNNIAKKVTIKDLKAHLFDLRVRLDSTQKEIDLSMQKLVEMMRAEQTPKSEPDKGDGDSTK